MGVSGPKLGGEFGARIGVAGHLKARHSLCPPELLAHLIEVLATQEWYAPVTIGHACGLVFRAQVRHAMIKYDRLLNIPPGMTREDASLFALTASITLKDPICASGAGS